MKKEANKKRQNKRKTKNETSYSPPDAFMEDTIRHNTAQMTSSKA